jgi:hypothetical protein
MYYIRGKEAKETTMKLSPEKLTSLKQMVAAKYGELRVNGTYLFVTEKKNGVLVGKPTRAGKKALAE